MFACRHIFSKLHLRVHLILIPVSREREREREILCAPNAPITEQGSVWIGCETYGGERSRPRTIWNFLTFRGTNDNSVFHGRATRKRREVIYKSDSSFVRHRRTILESRPPPSSPSPPVTGSTVHVNACICVYMRVYACVLLYTCTPRDCALSLFLPFSRRFATSRRRVRPKRTIRAAFPLPLPFSAITRGARRRVAFDLWLSYRPPPPSPPPHGDHDRGRGLPYIDESTEGRDCHSVCWSRGQLSVFFNQRFEERDVVARINLVTMLCKKCRIKSRHFSLLF